jgi:hypothetical protein
MYAKPPVEEVHKLLRQHLALVVHFSGVPGGGSTAIRYGRVSSFNVAILAPSAACLARRPSACLSARGRFIFSK